MDLKNRINSPLALLPVAVIAMVLALSGSPSAPARDAWESEAQQRKADYLYLEALNQYMVDHTDAALDLMRYAHALAPDDKNIAFDLAKLYFELGEPELTQEAYEMVSDYCRAYPDDYYSGMYHVTVCEYLGKDSLSTLELERLHRMRPDDIQAAYLLAYKYLMTFDSASLRSAAGIFDTLSRMVEGTPELLMRKINILQMLGDTTAIIADARRLASPPESYSATNLVQAAQIFHAVGDDDEALKCLQEACERSPYSGETVYSLATFYLECGDSAAYEREVSRALTLPDLDPEVKDEIISEYIYTHAEDSTKYDHIDSLLTDMVTLHPRDSEMRNIYAKFLLATQHYDEAAEQLDYSLDIDPSNYDNWDLLTRLRAYNEDYDGALATIDDALKFFPDVVDLYKLRAMIYGGAGDDDSALESIDMAIEKTDESVDREEMGYLYCMKGDIYQHQGDIEHAYENYDKALEYDPDNASLLNNYAYILAINDGDLDLAETMARRSLLLEPQNLNTVDTYAWIFFKKKDYQRARVVIDENIDDFLEDESTGAVFYEHAGDIYFMTGDADAAVEFWQKALELDGDNELLRRKVENQTYFFK